MKKQKFLPVLFGILMIVVGCLVLFDTFDITLKLWLLPVISATLLFFAIKNQNKVLRDIGVFVLILGIAVMVNEALVLSGMINKVFYLVSTAIALLVIAIFRKNGWLTLLGTFLLLIAGFMVLDIFDFSKELEIAYMLVLIATGLVVLFIVKNDKLGSMPLVIGVLCYLMSLPYFLVYAGCINNELARIIASALLIVSGVILVILVYIKTAKENESE